MDFLYWIADGNLQSVVDSFVKEFVTIVDGIIVNNAKLWAVVYSILKYFAIVKGEPGKNKLIDLYRFLKK